MGACAGAVTLWGSRLAGYLFWRVLQTGKDARLSQFFPKDDKEPFLFGQSQYPLKLAGFWSVQSLWSWIVLLPVTVSQVWSIPHVHPLFAALHRTGQLCGV